MSVRPISAAEAIADLAQFDTLVDARSEDEFAEDRVPGAVNWPSLVNEERKEVGTIYRQVGPFEARKRGAMLVAANIARHIGTHVADKPRGWKPLVYCWRGGQRSGALALVLGQIGFGVRVIEGGYKAFRAAIVEDIPRLAQAQTYRVICGPTGSGKTRLLHALRDAGAQVLDLEALANHRSSVLGNIPGVEQPTQKAFDTLVWDAMRRFDAAQPVFVESESKKVGNVAVPEALIERIRTSECVGIELAESERVALLMEDYDFFLRDRVLFCDRLDALVQLRGKAVVEGWKAKVGTGDFEPVVRELLARHYDPGYEGSMQRNFARYADARSLRLADRSPDSMARTAQELLRP